MKTVTAPHELDNLFDIEPGKTEILVPGGAPVTGELVEDDEEVEAVEGELVQVADTPIDLYDVKDVEIERQIDDVHEKAIEAYETMIVASQTVMDKKHAPRNAEVAAQFLQIALNASKEKNQIKDRKDKIIAMRKGPVSTTSVTHNTQNNIVTDRETARRLLKERNESGE